MNNKNKVSVLIDRLNKIGIHLELKGNIPWIYLYKINGKKVTEKYYSEYGFTIAYYNNEIKFPDTKEMFKLIRKYVC